MERKKVSRIEDILENSDKAEVIEKLSSALEIEGVKIVIIIGVPNEKGDLDMEVCQIGHRYRYEEYGFIDEGARIVGNFDGDVES